MQAVTSSGSAEQIAVSSLITYDLYKTYIHPAATPKQLIMVRGGLLNLGFIDLHASGGSAGISQHWALRVLPDQ